MAGEHGRKPTFEQVLADACTFRPDVVIGVGGQQSRRRQTGGGAARVCRDLDHSGRGRWRKDEHLRCEVGGKPFREILQQ